MSVLLLLVLPLLAEASVVETVPGKVPVVEVPHSSRGNCGLPPASSEKFDCTLVGNTWYAQYQYRVPGHYDLGCATYHLTQGRHHNELHLNGSFSRIPVFPFEATVPFYGNRFQRIFHGIWNCAMTGPCNMVYCHNDFYINHFCFLGYEVSQIFTRARTPSKKLMAQIWEAVECHPEVDKNKYVKTVC